MFLVKGDKKTYALKTIFYECHYKDSMLLYFYLTLNNIGLIKENKLAFSKSFWKQRPPFRVLIHEELGRRHDLDAMTCTPGAFDPAKRIVGWEWYGFRYYP